MFLPATFLQLKSVYGDEANPGKPRAVFVKPDQIIGMEVRNGNAKTEVNGEVVEKKICVTCLTIPFSEPIIVQESPDTIRKLIIQAFNEDMQQAVKMQTGGLLIAGGPMPPAGSGNRFN